MYQKFEGKINEKNLRRRVNNSSNLFAFIPANIQKIGALSLSLSLTKNINQKEGEREVERERKRRRMREKRESESQRVLIKERTTERERKKEREKKREIERTGRYIVGHILAHFSPFEHSQMLPGVG